MAANLLTVLAHILAISGWLGCVSVAAQTWAIGAVPLTTCPGSSRSLQRIPSPDGSATAAVSCRASGRDDEAHVVRLLRGEEHSEPLTLEKGSREDWRPQELLWAPDSRAFFVNGSESAYAGLAVVVYLVDGVSLTEHVVTHLAQREMASTFPPCKARNAELHDCQRVEHDPEFNMSAIAWINRSKLVVFAEVPCSSSYGGIMCQVAGFEVEVPSGRILRKMTAREVKEGWQSKSAWDIRIPDPPEFKP